MGTAHKNSWVLRRCFVHTCNNIPISVLHAVLILLGRVPRCRLSFKKALERQKTQNREGADEFYCHVWALKMRTRLKNTGNRRGDRVRYIHIIIRHETERMGDPRELCQTASAIRAEAAGCHAQTSPPAPLCRAEPPQRLSVCLIWRTQSARRGWKIKPAHRLQIKKLLRSDYPHEIFIISRWGDFHSDGTPGTIKPNYENTSPLPVHRCLAGAGGAGSG